MPWQINQFILWKCHALADKSIHSVEIPDDLSLPMQNMDELLTLEKKIRKCCAAEHTGKCKHD